MCMDRIDNLPPGETIQSPPMKTFPIIKDLVTDVSWNYEVNKKIPAFTPRPDGGRGAGRRLPHAADRHERGQEFRKCIECFLCQDVCHVMRDHAENKTSYAGPRFFVRSAALEMHPLDDNDRLELLRKTRVGICNITKCCTEVCPEHIKITDNAIIPLKERVVDATYDPIAWLGRKIRNRRAPRTPSEAAATAPSTGPAAVQPSPEVHGIPEPDTDRPQPYWESGLTETDAQTTTVVPDGLTAVPDGLTAVPEGPMAVPGEPADGGDDAND